MNEPTTSIGAVHDFTRSFTCGSRFYSNRGEREEVRRISIDEHIDEHIEEYLSVDEHEKC